MSTPVSDHRRDVLSIGGTPIPIGTDDGPTVTRQPTTRMGDSVGGQPRPIEVVGDPMVEIQIPVGAMTVGNRLLAAAGRTAMATALSGGGLAALGEVSLTTRDGYRFSGLGYVEIPEEFAGGISTPQRTYTIRIPRADVSAAGVDAALAAAGVVS